MENHGAPEAGQLTTAWTRGCGERQRVAKERAALRVRSRAVQNEMDESGPAKDDRRDCRVDSRFCQF